MTPETESKNMASSFWFADNPAEQREEKKFFMTAKLFRESDVSFAAASVHTWSSQRRDNVDEVDAEGVF